MRFHLPNLFLMENMRLSRRICSTTFELNKLNFSHVQVEDNQLLMLEASARTRDPSNYG